MIWDILWVFPSFVVWRGIFGPISFVQFRTPFRSIYDDQFLCFDIMFWILFMFLVIYGLPLC